MVTCNKEDTMSITSVDVYIIIKDLQEFLPNLAESVSFHQVYSILLAWHNCIKWFLLRFGYIRNIVRG